jgi:hypothetical protein
MEGTFKTNQHITEGLNFEFFYFAAAGQYVHRRTDHLPQLAKGIAKRYILRKW